MIKRGIALAIPFVFGYNTHMILMNLDSFRDPEFWKLLVCAIPVMLLSLTLHEWGHAFAAHLCGDDTAKNLGRMTLNPLKHIDPVGFLMILLVGFGWAKPVPVNSRNYRNYKVGEAVVSLAGIAMNLLLAILFSVLFVIFLPKYVYNSYSWLENGLLIKILIFGISLNIILMLFNLLPFYPLDGSHIFELLFAKRLPIKVLLFLRRYGYFILIGLLLFFRLIGFSPINALSDWIIGKLVAIAL